MLRADCTLVLPLSSLLERNYMFKIDANRTFEISCRDTGEGRPMLMTKSWEELQKEAQEEILSYASNHPKAAERNDFLRLEARINAILERPRVKNEILRFEDFPKLEKYKGRAIVHRVEIGGYSPYGEVTEELLIIQDYEKGEETIISLTDVILNALKGKEDKGY